MTAAAVRVRIGRLVRLDEDWQLVLLGTVAVLATVGLGVLTATGTHDRDVRLVDAAATAQRLSVDGLDDSLTSDLTKLQRDEETYFQQQLTSAILPEGGDPRLDVETVQADLLAVTQQITDSAQVQSDATLINYRLPNYLTLEATALGFVQQVQVGTAYLQDASEYLRDQILPVAADIRAVDQRRVVDDIADTASIPTALTAAAGVAVVCLLSAQVVLARRTHRMLNPGMAAASVIVMALIVWSLTATLLERGQVTGDQGAFETSVARGAVVDWADYAAGVASAGGTLDGLVLGGLLLGLLAGVAAGAGVGWRVAEYWSTGGSSA